MRVVLCILTALGVGGLNPCIIGFIFILKMYKKNVNFTSDTSRQLGYYHEASFWLEVVGFMCEVVLRGGCTGWK